MAGLRSVLVIHFRFLGDLVLLSALFRNLRMHLPGARLVVLADAGYEEVLRAQPDVDEMISFPRERLRGGPFFRQVSGWLGLVRDLRARRFDLVIDTADDRTSYSLVRMLNASVRVGYRPSQRPRRFWEGRPYNVFARPFGSGGSHFLERYLAPLEALGLPVIEGEPRLVVRPADRQAAEHLMRHHSLAPGEFVVIHPGARLATKRWPIEGFARVIDVVEKDAGLTTVLIGGADERPLADSVFANAGTRPVDLVGQLSFGQLAALLANCRLYIGNNTGPMHVAAAVGAPVVGLFGLVSPAVWGPVGEGHIALQAPMPCRCPFPEICRPPYPDKTLCVRRIAVDEVVGAVRRQLTHNPLANRAAI